MAHVVIFAPSPLLTVTVEEHPDGGDVHVHAGGQGVWQARMLLRLGVRVTMCSVLSGEGGGVIRHLLDDEGIEVTPPTMEVTDTRGAGDSLTAGVASSLAAGEPIAEAILVGAAAGALNVTRHGLGTGDAEAIEALRGRVSARPFATTPEPGENVSPAGLAARVEEK